MATAREAELEAATTYVDGPTGNDLERNCVSCTSFWMATIPKSGDEDGPAHEVCPPCVEAGFGPTPEPRHFTVGRSLRYRRRTGPPWTWYQGRIEAFPSNHPDDGPNVILVRANAGELHHVVLAASQVDLLS